MRLQKNISVINQDGGSRCDNDDETKEGIPVYLEPANQTADFGNTKDTISAHNVPRDKLQWSGENRQNIKSYAGKQTKGASPTKLRSTNAHLRQDQDRQVQYEETMIDHKRYVYDSPRANIDRKRKTEPWETYSYQHNESPEAGGCAMASGRGLNFPIKPLSRSKPVHGSPPDINPYDNLLLEDVGSHIYATPEINVEKEIQVKEKVKDQGKSRKSKGTSIKSKLPSLSRFLHKYKRRSTVDVNGGYELPNPVNSTHASQNHVLSV